jgi:hypothetical protein
MYDRDSPDEHNLAKHDFLGAAETTLGALMGSRGQSLDLKLNDPAKGKKDIGHVFLRGEELSQCRDTLKLRLSAIKLDNKDGFFSKSDPFFTFSKCRENGEWVRVHKSEVIKSNLNPNWLEAVLSVQKLCNGDVHRPLLLEVWDWNASGKEDFIGSAEVSVNSLQSNAETKQNLDCINKQIQQKKGKKYKNSGQVIVQNATVTKQYSMLDYLRGGCEISMVCCIDFTASNGAPSDPNSLHYMDPSGRPNEYQSAIAAVGTILEEYDYDKRFPVYGFGGIVSGTNQVSHCFPMTFDPNYVEVERVAGILGCYSNALQCVRLHGPTCFAPIIQAASTLAHQCHTGLEQKYIVLLIITDGVIMDMDRTRDAVVAACHLPLSIIIVGVGGADFTSMEQLDGDDEVLRSSTGTAASRDIVQFVPFSKYKHLDPSFLAKDTLIEVPEQLTSYMKYPPPPPPQQN